MTDQDWYQNWIASMSARSSFEESWDGARFQQHPVIRDSLRNILFLISIDGLPIFKKVGYSLWVLTASPSNWTRSRRADQGVFIVGVVEGPHEPKCLNLLIGDMLSDLADLSKTGCFVFDAITNKNILVKAAPVAVCCDLPASSKLCEFLKFSFISRLTTTTGGHAGHSSYIWCPRCHYSGSVCGCKEETSDVGPPAKFDNEARTSPTDYPVLLSGFSRKKRTGEHIVFIDSASSIPVSKYRNEIVHRRAQCDVNKMSLKAPSRYGAALKARHIRLHGVTSFSPMNQFSPTVFRLTRDNAIDGFVFISFNITQN